MDKSTIEMAILGLEEQKKKIEHALAELRNQSGIRGRSRRLPTSSAAVSSPLTRKRRTMSAEARRKISESMKRRHAERAKARSKK